MIKSIGKGSKRVRLGIQVMKTKIRKSSLSLTPGRMIEIETEKPPVSLSPDLVIEILKTFPVKFVTKCLLVSKQWAAIIRSQEFIRSFPFPSPQPDQLRCLFAVYSLDKYSGCGRYNWFFYLSSSSLVETEHHQQPISSLSSTKCQIPYRRRCFSDVHYVNGLISLGYGHQQIINNPSTGKSVYLPRVKSRKQIIQSYFGFDPVDFKYKVLCMSERMNDYSNVPCSDHQVITVGVRREKQSWRMIECNTPHCPKTNGVCIDGVLYYGAFTGLDMVEWCIMRFDVRTEKLDFCSGLNENVECFRSENPPCLINYQGKVALASETSLNTFDLWVMEDAEKWSKIRLSVGLLLREDATLSIRGTIHTGEIVFVSSNTIYGEGDFRPVTCVFFYNHRENRVRQVIFGVKFKFSLGTYDCTEYVPNISLVVPFLDYIESAMLL